MVYYPGCTEAISSEGLITFSKRTSFYNEAIALKSYNVYVTPTAGNSLASIQLSKELIKSYKDEIEVILLNKAKVQVCCKSAGVANKIVSNLKGLKKFNFYIPQQKVEVKGRIYMPKEVSEQEAFEGMIVKNRINTNAPLPKIVEVYRIPYFEKDLIAGHFKKTDSDYMLVSFCGSHVPTHVLYEDALLIPVQAYFEPVLQCKNCWFFGHSKRACRGKEKCVTCGLTHSGKCDSLPFCVNCKDEHWSNDKRCPEFLKRKELAKAKALKTVPTGVNVNPTPTPASFDIFKNIAFPELPPIGFTKTVKKVPEPSKKRKADKNILELQDTVKLTPESVLEDISEKIIEDLSLEETFFNTIVEEVKSSAIDGLKLRNLISNKIITMLKPSSKDTEITPMDSSDGAGPSHSS